MPSANQHRAGDVDRETFPMIRDAIGEDPARFLDRPLLDEDNDRELLWARIRGMDYIETVEAFIEVELQLERGPRKKIIGRLNERKQELEQHGERWDGVDREAIEAKQAAATTGETPTTYVHSECEHEVKAKSDVAYRCPECEITVGKGAVREVSAEQAGGSA